MLRKATRMALWSLSSLTGLLIIYNAGAAGGANWTESSEERHASSGILIGAEPRDLGPQDSPFAILFVHGFVGAGNNFNALPEQAAAAGWRVRVMLLPGHGTRASALKNMDPQELREAVQEELLALREKHSCVVLAGHSMGGALSVLTAANNKVDGLILGAPYFGITHRWYYGLRPETWIRLSSPIVRWVYKGKLFLQVNDKSTKDSIVSYKWIPSHASVTLNEIGGFVNNPEVLKQVECPVILFHAKGDVAASYEASKSAFSALGSEDKTFVDLPRSNHHIFWDYDKDTVFRESLSFLNRIQEMKKTGEH